MNHSLETEFLITEISTSGAELKSICNAQTGEEYLWNGDANWWPRHAPVLFPIVGKLNNGSYRVNGVTYSLPQHGFARDLQFELHDKTDSSICFLLRSNADTLAIYPFPFELQIRYTLVDKTLHTAYTVKNTGAETMLFSIGAHPGYACPVSESEHFSDYYLEFAQEETLERHLLRDGLFTGDTEHVPTPGNILPLRYELFEKDALVFKNLKSEVIYLRSRTSGYSLKFEFPGFPYFGIWTKPGAPFICLEPWCGLADNVGFSGELSQKEGIISLASGEVFERVYSVQFGE